MGRVLYFTFTLLFIDRLETETIAHSQTFCGSSYYYYYYLQPLESLQTHIHTRELGRRRLVQGAAGFQNQKKAGSARLAPSREMIQQG